MFKFCTADVARFLLEGRIRVSSLAYFAHLETVHGWAGIGDRFEAGGQIKLEGRYDIAELADNPAGRVFVGTGSIISRNSAIPQPTPAVHAFCITHGDLEEMAPILCDDVNGYTRVIEIRDPEGFARALLETGSINGRPASEAFSEAKFGSVVYGRKETDARDREGPLSGCLTKPSAFEGQKEARICLINRRPRLHDVQDIVLPEPERWLSDTGFNRTCSAAPDRPAMLWEADLAAALKAAIHAFELHGRLVQLTFEGHRQASARLPVAALNPKNAATPDGQEYARIRALERSDMETHSDALTQLMESAHKLVWQARVLHGIRLDTEWTGRRPYTGKFTDANDLRHVLAVLEGEKLDPRLAADAESYCSPDGSAAPIPVHL